MKRTASLSFKNKPFFKKNDRNLQHIHTLCLTKNRRANPPSQKPLTNPKLFTDAQAYYFQEKNQQLKENFIIKGHTHRESKQNIEKQVNQKHFQQNHSKKSFNQLSQKYFNNKCMANNLLSQLEVANDRMRTTVVEWIIDISHRFKLQKETLFIAVHLLDRSLGLFTKINLDNLQLFAITVLLMAGKYQEVKPLFIETLLEYCLHYYSKRQVIAMEAKVLDSIGFELTFPTRFSFCTFQSQSLQNNQKIKQHFVLYMLQLSLLEFWKGNTENDIYQAASFLAEIVLKKNQKNRKKPITDQRILENAYKIVQLWKNNQSSSIAAFYDTKDYSFVGGLCMLS